MTPEEKQYWGNTPQHTIDFANTQCAKNRARMLRENMLRAIRDHMAKGIREIAP